MQFDDTSPPTSINIKCNCALPSAARWKKVGVRVPPRLPRGKRKEIYRVTRQDDTFLFVDCEQLCYIHTKAKDVD